MGKQVGFVLTLQDERAMIYALQQKFGPFVMLESTSTLERVVVSELNETIRDECLVLVREHQVNQVISNYYPNVPWHCIDKSNSEVIEFTRCSLTKGRLYEGRLWYDRAWFKSPDQIGWKSDSFCAWADSILRWVRRHYERSTERTLYIGPDAARCRAEGSLTF